MVRLNQHALEAAQLNKLLLGLSETVAGVRHKQVDKFLSELLGFEERIMLAKRIAIIVLIKEGCSLYEISNLLKVSPSTAAALKQKLQKGELDHVLHALSKDKKSYLSILNTIDSILHLGGKLPRYGSAITIP